MAISATMEDITVRFYNIERCGYYKGTGEGSVHELCNVEDMFDNLQRWIKGKTLEQTKTDSALKRKSLLPTYCFNVEKSGKGHFFVTTWNEIASVDGQVASLSKNSKVDEIKDVEKTPLPEDNIPGFSTYFWIIPEDNVLATVRFKHLEVAHEKLNVYLSGFLKLFTSYTIKEPTPDDKTKFNILGYGSSKEDYDAHIHPYYRSKLIRKEGKTEIILDNIENISKLTRKKVLEHSLEADKDTYANIFKNLLGISNKKLQEPVAIKYEMNITPTKEEVESIIKEWKEHHSEDSWDDVGFSFTGSTSQPHWLSNEIPTWTAKIKVDRHDAELVQAHKMLTFLDSKYEELKKLYS